jgi:hypothetical protein
MGPRPSLNPMTHNKGPTTLLYHSRPAQMALGLLQDPHGSARNGDRPLQVASPRILQPAQDEMGPQGSHTNLPSYNPANKPDRPPHKAPQTLQANRYSLRLKTTCNKMNLQWKSWMDSPSRLARVDIAPLKPNQQWKGFAKTPMKTLAPRALQIRDQIIMRKVKCYPSFILLRTPSRSLLL